MKKLSATALSQQFKPYLKKSEAFKKYRRKNVEHWIREGLITPRKDGEFSAAWRIDLLEIESVKNSMELSDLFFEGGNLKVVNK
ncbi:hypothetical protein [Sphingobacterium sp. LRF_L2]|uniref:hypothetical protein n=1 Tax=Sphingobacterium sp. LRF_L2 TaxID=3369421 RepID=UPI003F6413DB